MGQTRDHGTRIELVPMDVHFQDITVALYRQGRDGEAQFLVHSYSTLDGTAERIAYIREAMAALGGMELAPDSLLRFGCGSEHELACKRLFLESCKLDPTATPMASPMAVFDKKGNCNITVLSRGNGVYQATTDSDGTERRLAILEGGLAKLAELEDRDNAVAFACGCPHDALIGLLMSRALNVRAAIREAEQSAGRGVLAVPSQQN